MIDTDHLKFAKSINLRSFFKYFVCAYHIFVLIKELHLHSFDFTFAHMFLQLVRPYSVTVDIRPVLRGCKESDPVHLYLIH